MVIHPSRQRIPSLLIRWPWLLVGVAWAIAVLATPTGQRLLIDHHFLLEESGLAWPLAAAIFLVGWQVMIAAMMAPSSIPTVMPRVKAALIRSGFSQCSLLATQAPGRHLDCSPLRETP